MLDGSVPKGVEEKLLDGEKVIGNWWHFYATNKRLIRYNRKSDYGILDYNKISITLKIMTSFIWVAAFMIIMGFIIFFLASIFDANSNYFWLYWVILICSIVGGILFAISNKYYQFKSLNLNEKELKKWLIPKGKKTDRFIEIIKKQSGISIEK